MFAQGPCDEGLKRISPTVSFEAKKLQVPNSGSAGETNGAGDDSSECPAQRELIDKAFITDTNNKACEMYKRGLLDDSLGVLRALSNHIKLSRDNNPVRQHANLHIILRNIAQVHFARGELQKSLDYIEKAIDASISVRASDDLIASLWLNMGCTLWQLGRSRQEAEYALSQSLNLLTKLRSEISPSNPNIIDRDIVSAQTTLLLILLQRDGLSTSEEARFLRLLVKQRSMHGYNHTAVSDTLFKLGTLYMKEQHYTCATNFFLESLRIQNQLKLCEVDKLATLVQLGQCLSVLGCDVEAMSCFREALRMKGTSIHQETPEIQLVFAAALYHVGMIQSSYGDHIDHQRRTRALHSFRLCLELRRKVLGSTSPAVASVLHNIGMLLLEEGRVGQSMKFFQESLEIRRRVYGSQHHEVASSLRHIGKVYNELGKDQESMKLYLEALWILRQSSHDCSEQLIDVLVGLGESQHALGLTTQALKSYDEVSRLLREGKGKGLPNTTRQMVHVLNIMGDLALDMMDIQSANRFFEEAAQISGQEHIVFNESPPCAAAA
jgi:tetratricopeptide (TPR) repeat protein